MKRDLFEQTETMLAFISELTSRQLEAFRNQEYGQVMQLDRELELAIGEKERLFGAVRQHRSEHGC